MTVTASESRDADDFLALLEDFLAALLADEPERWCAARFGAWGGSRDCESRNGDPHCPICHAPNHVACHECGDDLRYASQAVTRVDRSYCSNACRQRAYRRRTKEA